MIINGKEFKVLTVDDLKEALLKFKKEDNKKISCSVKEFSIYLKFIIETQTDSLIRRDFQLIENTSKVPPKERLTDVYTQDYGNIIALIE